MGTGKYLNVDDKFSCFTGQHRSVLCAAHLISLMFQKSFLVKMIFKCHFSLFIKTGQLRPNENYDLHKDLNTQRTTCLKTETIRVVL